MEIKIYSEVEDYSDRLTQLVAKGLYLEYRERLEDKGTITFSWGELMESQALWLFYARRVMESL